MKRDVVVVAVVPAARLRWLADELDGAGVPYEVQRGDTWRGNTYRAELPTAKPAQRGGVTAGARWWLLAGAVFTLLFGLFDLSTWGRPELTIPRRLGWDASTTAGAVFAAVLCVVVWWRLATGPKPAGYKPLIPDSLSLVIVLALGAFVAWLLAEGALY